MLDIMRRQKRLKLILWAVIAGLTLTMGAFFVPGINMSSDSSDSDAATIDGNAISMREYLSAYYKKVERLRKSEKNLTPDALKNMGIPKKVLDEMVSNKVLDILAKRFGIEVTPAEVRQAVQSNPNLQFEGKFIGVDRYKALLAENDLTAEDYEGEISRMQLIRKLSEIITDSLDVGEREMREEFIRSNQKTQVDYVLFKKTDYGKSIKPTEAELRSYFDAHKDAYRVMEKRRVQYLAIPAPQFLSSIQVTQAEIEAEWNKWPHGETVEASHIFFTVRGGAKDADIKAKAEEVLKRVKAGEDFAALATKYSEDKGTAARGGSLGPIRRGQTDKDFEAAAFSLKPGEISGLVRSQFGYHIIKVTKHETPSIESNRANLASAVQINKAQDQAKSKAEEAFRLLEKQNDLGQVAGKLGVKTEIKETAPFAKSDNPFDFGISQAMRDEIFEMKAVNSIGKPVEYPAGYAVPKLIEVQMARPADFAESKSMVEKEYAEVKGNDLLLANANKLSEEAKKLGSLEKAAKAMKLSIKTSQEFTEAGTPDIEIGTNTPFNQAAFDLEVGGISAPKPIYGNMAVFQVKSRTPIDESAYKKEKGELRMKLLQSLREPYFQDYIQRAMEGLEKSGKIRVNPKAVERASMYY
jgi:peptidyl-prolyl cis-trans isomerase D